MKSYHNLVCFSFVLHNVDIVAIVDTDPIVSSCVDCGRSLRTYVPDSYSNLPDGSSVTFSTPQTQCPLCDPCGYGDFMNEDLFPELART